MSLESVLIRCAAIVETQIERATQATIRATRWCGRVISRFLGLLRLGVVYANLVIGYTALASFGHEIILRAHDRVGVGLGILLFLVGFFILCILIIGPFVSKQAASAKDKTAWKVHAFATMFNLGVVYFTIAKVPLQSPILSLFQEFLWMSYAAILYVVNAAKYLVEILPFGHGK